MNKIIMPAIAAILVLGIGLSQEVYGPEEPEKLSLGGNGYNSSTGAFEITALVQLPKDAPIGYTVYTSVELFKPDGTPIRAAMSTTDRVPEEGVSEGGNNHSVHKLTIRMSYDPTDDGIQDQRIKVVVSSELFDPDGNTVDQKTKKSWKKLAADGITGP